MERDATKPYAPLDEEVVERWLSSVDVSQTTRRAYRAGIRAFLAYVRAVGLDFDAIDEQDVLGFKEHLALERRLSPASVSLYLAAVRSFYRFAEGSGLANPARNVHGSKAPRAFRREALSAEQARELATSFEGVSDERGLRDRAIVTLMLFTGLRDIEVVRANLADLTKDAGHDVLRVRGKGRQEADAVVKLTPDVVWAVNVYLACRRRERGELSPTDPLFVSTARRNPGGRLTTRSISSVVKRALQRIGIDDPRYTAHSLRHTAVTLALLGGATESEAQAMARHANISTTMIYSHHINRLENAAEDKVAALIGPLRYGG